MCGLLGYAVFLAAWTWIILNNVQASLTSYWSDEIASGPIEMLTGMARAGGLFLGTDHLLLGAMLLVALALGARRAPNELRILVWGPVLLAGAASLLGVPLGTGRTDLYLYAPLAIACAWTLQELFRARTGLLIGLALILVSAIPLEPAAYPVEDTRPLIQDVDSLMTSDSTLIAIGAEYALMTYAEWPVSMEVRRVPSAIRSWIPVHHDVDVRSGLSWWETRDQLAEAFPTDLSDRVLVLHTHVPHERLRWANDELEQRGFEHERTHIRPGASLTVYERHQD